MTVTRSSYWPCTTSASEGGSAPKRQKLKAEKGKHAPGYKTEWKREFTWLEPVRNENSQVVGLICELCKRHKRKNKFNQSTVWSETPCSTVQRMPYAATASASNTKGQWRWRLVVKPQLGTGDRASPADAARREKGGSEDSHAMPFLAGEIGNPSHWSLQQLTEGCAVHGM